MEIFITIIHYIVCIFLIIVILLQAGKGADIGAAFGAGGSQTIFGPRGAATFLNKMTAVVAMVFMITSASLVYLSKQTRGSVLENVALPPPTSETMPAAPLSNTPENDETPQ
jgi:preprotein translocase subunit SecG